MKCPECGSSNVSKVSILDEKWQIGAERCQDCQHQAHWLAFCEGEEFRKVRLRAFKLGRTRTGPFPL